MQAAMVIGGNVCQDYPKASHLEWLETNGLGGFACGTVSGAHTRRYHGLLVASLNPPVDRYVLLSKLEETLLIEGQRHEFSCNQYRLVVQPQGYRNLKQFRLDPFPTWVYQIKGVRVEKSVFMVHGENTSVICYRLLDPGQDHFAVLAVRPLIAFREYHHLTCENSIIRPQPEIEEPGFLQIHPYDGLPALRFCHNGFGFTISKEWYRRFEYLRELERGLDYCEDLFSPGYFTYELSENNRCAFLVATLRETNGVFLKEVEEMESAEKARRQQLIAGISDNDELASQLTLASDAFLVKRSDGSSSIIAGYPWFTEWGRDSMISLPGLTITTRRLELAQSVLKSMLKYCDQGMLPNSFPDSPGRPSYNSMDTALWLFRAAYEYFNATHDRDFIRNEVFPVMREVILAYRNGTRYDIHADPLDGLLTAAAEGEALTWMEAKVKGKAVTPRQGKAVDVNALWHNALRVMAEFSRELACPEKYEEYRQLADQVKASFSQVFWNEDERCLYDYVDGDYKDGKIRPNQILSVSMPFRLLPLERAKAVVHTVQTRLLTAFGLRSLDSTDISYRGRCRGNVYERDAAYHQGSVWPWLLGPFVDAYLNVHGSSEQSVTFLLSLFEPLKKHLSMALLGSVSEFFEGDLPHLPRGCGAQAWSVAEVLRVYQKLRVLQSAGLELSLEELVESYLADEIDLVKAKTNIAGLLGRSLELHPDGAGWDLRASSSSDDEAHQLSRKEKLKRLFSEILNDNAD